MANAIDFNALMQFLSELKDNNHKAWFDVHRPRYQALRTDFVGFVDVLIERGTAVDTTLAGLQSKQSIFRINRDVRFSANKNPYKTNFSAYLSKGGKKFNGAGYYFHFEPGASFIAAGVWMPEPEVLKAIRQEIDYNLEVFTQLINAPAVVQDFKLEGDTLTRPPKGYEADNPAVSFLKLKSFVLTCPMKTEGVAVADLLTMLTNRMHVLRPFVQFINEPLSAPSP